MPADGDLLDPKSRHDIGLLIASRRDFDFPESNEPPMKAQRTTSEYPGAGPRYLPSDVGRTVPSGDFSRECARLSGKDDSRTAFIQKDEAVIIVRTVPQNWEEKLKDPAEDKRYRKKLLTPRRANDQQAELKEYLERPPRKKKRSLGIPGAASRTKEVRPGHHDEGD